MSILTALSTPLTALLALPLLSSWSTTLNLAFVSLTYTTLALTHSPLSIELYGTTLIRLILFLLPSLLFLAFDLLLPSLAVEVKAQGERGLPGSKRGRGGRGGRVCEVLGWSVLNVVLGIAVQVGLEWVATEVLGVRSLLSIKGSKWGVNHLPNPWGMVKHLVVGYVGRNVLAYYIHTGLLHSPSIPFLTHYHLTWAHTLPCTPYSLTAAYDHPICFLLHKFLPLYLPAILFRFHITTYLILLALFSLEELFTYSGYTVLPSTVMLRGMARRTDAHMMSKGKGNFGPVGMLDWVHGTSLKGSNVVKDVGEEMDKHDVIDQAGSAANGIGSRVRDRMSKGRGKK
ncbi:hypothetical protein GQ43DRAFT_437014 [Delitschia confertaspora ATCC 74209]|uniref:Fatty acid hydroxylase domain-containing protein n=1 Tax=Delitschia confertaspora ATCC 74209 TaxID=1513339 RepID=A0A9P4JUN8_9PLEO|nr:hypothetical protein GQ43DRAFT_437014 [Delitschia confertaspora ATCC 74209]